MDDKMKELFGIWPVELEGWPRLLKPGMSAPIESQEKATRISWERPYHGEAANALLAHIQRHFSCYPPSDNEARSFLTQGFARDNSSLRIRCFMDALFEVTGEVVWVTLWWGDFDVQKDIIIFAGFKLLKGKFNQGNFTEDQMFARLSQRIPIQFNSTTSISRAAERKQVEAHMRICLEIEETFGNIETMSSSEPVLSEAAYAIMKQKSFDPLRRLRLPQDYWKGAGVLCAARNKPSVDAINNFLLSGTKLDLDNFGLVFYQLKTDPRYTDAADPETFNSMDPFQIGILEEGDDPVPLIRVVFALAAEILDVHVTRHDPSTSSYNAVVYDIWCAGLSSDFLALISRGADSAQSEDVWKGLLRASDRWKEIYDAETDTAERLRKSMNPGTANVGDFWSNWAPRGAAATRKCKRSSSFIDEEGIYGLTPTATISTTTANNDQRRTSLQKKGRN
ncbi:hypothetical protein CPB84DRAFT_1747474 [Gymnopilus junonius]|uniref:Uncharacterized protein n=1 Tax=Gymnopilus junonius TaxID=109634 RepID=A0A9P5NN82_GYMJU|nr:hypothetical protein CPB84DRAFT_1747474 [Gymnopilus junonius]